jgi:glycosyltransferase involved in cell wall biosynthesis
MGQHKTNKGERRLSVTVCIPTIKGREEYLMRAELSVMQQNRQPDDLMVLMDEERRGAAWARNEMLSKVGTDVIAWLDDDDWIKESHIRACMRVLENSPDTDLVYPRPQMVGGRDPTAVTHQGVFPTSPWGLRFSPEFAQHIRHIGSFIPMTHLVRTETVRAAGGFPEGRTLDNGRYQGEDERYLINMLDQGAVFEHLDQRTWYWNVNSKSTAGKGITT